MKRWWLSRIWPAVILLVPGPLIAAQTPRDVLTIAAFTDRTRDEALNHIREVEMATAAVLAQRPNDREASVLHATAVGYRAKLTGSRSDAIASRKQFEALAARDPRNPEAIAGVGAWHIGVINKFGRIVGRTVLGAQRDVGLAALDRAVSLGGDRAMFLGLNGLLRLQLDPDDPRARALTEAAAKGSTPTALDRQMQRAATLMLEPLRAGKDKDVRALSKALLPLGRIPQ